MRLVSREFDLVSYYAYLYSVTLSDTKTNRRLPPIKPSVWVLLYKNIDTGYECEVRDTLILFKLDLLACCICPQ